jgi:hypothetical protein
VECEAQERKDKKEGRGDLPGYRCVACERKKTCLDHLGAKDPAEAAKASLARSCPHRVKFSRVNPKPKGWIEYRECFVYDGNMPADAWGEVKRRTRGFLAEKKGQES